MIIIPRNPEPLMSRLEELGGVQHKRLRLYGVDLVVAWPDVDPSSLGGLGGSGGDVVIPAATTS